MVKRNAPHVDQTVKRRSIDYRLRLDIIEAIEKKAKAEETYPRTIVERAVAQYLGL